MEMSKAKTEANNAEVEAAIQRREENKRLAKEAAERREKQERERQEKLRQIQAEQEKRQKEKERLREAQAQEKAKEAERKQQEQMQKLRHPAFDNRDKEAGAGRHRKKKADSDDEEEGYSGSTLTRAEKRALKTDPDARPAWAQKLVGGSSSNGRAGSSAMSAAHSPGKGKRGPNHQVNFAKVLNAPSALAAQGDQSLPIRERLKQSDYFAPIKLSAVKRDTRTQADYFQEKRQKALAAKGDDPYADWFSKSKSDGGSGSDSKLKSSTSKPTSASRLTSASTPSVNKMKPAASSYRNDSPGGSRKRRRSESLSSSDLDSDFARKRPKARSALSSQIWQMVTGKDRSHYVDDVFSDEEDDMEVSMAEVAREEARA